MTCARIPLLNYSRCDGCEIIEEPVDNNTDTGDNTTITDPTDPTDPTEPGDNTGSTDGSTDTSDDTESESVICIIHSNRNYWRSNCLIAGDTYVCRGRGSKSDAYSMQEKAYADAGYAASRNRRSRCFNHS